MNLKIEDLEKEFQNRNQFAAGDLDDSCTNISQYSVASSNLIQQSMKDALMVMNESVDSQRFDPQSKTVKGPPKSYERLIQKLESDVRGHIRVIFISFKISNMFLFVVHDIAGARNEDPHGLFGGQD